MTIVLNGKETGPAKVYPRELDTMFDEARVSIRASRYYGWLYSVVFERLAIPEPRVQEEPEAGALPTLPDLAWWLLAAAGGVLLLFLLRKRWRRSSSRPGP